MGKNCHLQGLAALAMLLASPALAVDRLVPSVHPTIADAVAAASATGDRVVIVTAGSYDGFLVNSKDLDIVNLSGGVVTITATINIDGPPAILLDGLAITAGGGNGVSVNNAGATVTIRDCVISGSNQGVRINDSSTVVLDGTLVTGNSTGLVRDGGPSSGAITISSSSAIDANLGRGIELYRAVALGIVDSQVSNNGGDGIFIDNDPGVALSLDGSRVNQNGGNGIDANRGCTITVEGGSQVNANGGTGIRRLNGSGQPTTITISGSDVSTNQTNVDLVENASLEITGSTVNNASAYGVWLRDRGVGQVVLAGSDFRNNSGGNLRVENTAGAGSTTLLAERSRFERSGGGVSNVYLQNGTLAPGSGFANCVIHEGSPQLFSLNDNGSASTIRVDFCTVASRFATTGDGVRIVADNGSSVTGSVLNSIIVGADRALNFEGNGTVSVSSDHNIVRGNAVNYNGVASAGPNDLPGADPLFTSPTTGSLETALLTLQAASPAVDAANLALSPGVTTDLAGTPRPVGPAADMGAYEFGDLSVDVLADRRTITVDGDPADWAGIGSDTLALDTGGRGQLLASVQLAWDSSHLYILVREQAGDLLAKEAASQGAYALEPYNFDTVALFLDLDNSNNGEQVAQDFSPWLGLSSTGRSDLFAYRSNNDALFIGALLPASALATSGALGSRVIEASLAWSDLALVVNTGRQPLGGLVAAIAPGFSLGCEPLLIDDDFTQQSFIGGSQFTAPSGLDANSRNVVLQEPGSSVADWILLH